MTSQPTKMPSQQQPPVAKQQVTSQRSQPPSDKPDIFVYRQPNLQQQDLISRQNDSNFSRHFSVRPQSTVRTPLDPKTLLQMSARSSLRWPPPPPFMYPGNQIHGNQGAPSNQMHGNPAGNIQLSNEQRMQMMIARQRLMSMVSCYDK